MKLFDKMKCFYLKKQANGGFTLVELIVVIAILAILAGVAVPMYSGYVEKANKQADMQLVSDIEKALELAGYNGTFEEGEGGFVVIRSNAAPETSSDNVKRAMAETFGDGWENSGALTLKYNNWGNSGILPDAEKAYVVANSSFMTGNRQDKLLSDVEKMTNMAQNLVTSLTSGGEVFSDMTLSGMFSYMDAEGNVVCVLDDTAKKYGIDKGNYATWEDWAAESDENKNAYSNLLVLSAADESEKYMDDPYGYDMTGASDMILEFSSFYAFAATDDDFSAVLDTHMEKLSEVTDVDSGKAWYNDLKGAADAAGYSTYLANAEIDGDPLTNIDKLGFLGILSGLGNPTEEQAESIGADISNKNLFTDGIVNDMYNEYLDSVAVVNSLASQGKALELAQGEIAVIVKMEGSSLVVFNTLPID